MIIYDFIFSSLDELNKKKRDWQIFLNFYKTG